MQRTHKEGKQLGLSWALLKRLNLDVPAARDIIPQIRCEILIMDLYLVTIWPFYCCIKIKLTVFRRVRCRLKFGFLLENFDFDFLSRLPSAVKRRDSIL